MGKIIITEQNSRLLLSLFENNKPELLTVVPSLKEKGIIGNIYLARVKDVVPAIKGVFLNLSAQQTVYLPFGECQNLLLANRELPMNTETGRVFLKQGDEVVVQVSGEAVKTKPPSATGNLTLTGQYCVCEYFGHGLKYSHKMNSENKKLIDSFIRKQEIPGRKNYGFVIRTNAEELTDYEALCEEMRKFISVFNTITDTYRHRTCYSCLYQKEAEIIGAVKNIPMGSYEEIVTDREEVYTLLEENLMMDDGTSKELRLYRDEMLSLAKLYSIETHLREVLGKRVWLPGGGYLVIEPTEAMIVIDVNSGKTQGRGRKYEQYILSVNLEAAKEVARQLRLRNYSGMIMVDFINMECEEDKQLLLKKLDGYLKEDKVRTRLIDMTALGIVEITRKKTNKPLADLLCVK